MSFMEGVFARTNNAIEGIVRCGTDLSNPAKLVLIHLLLLGPPKSMRRLEFELGLSADLLVQAMLELADRGFIDAEMQTITDNVLTWAGMGPNPRTR